MKTSIVRGLAVLIVIIVSLVANAQSYDNMSSDGSRTLVREYYEGPSVLVSKDYQYQFTKPSVSKDGTYIRTGRAGEYGWVHYRNENQFRYDSLAGRRLICDKATDLPMQIVECKNLVWQRSVKTETRTFKYERTKVREYVATHEAPRGPPRIVEVPGPERFFPVLLLAPQQQYIANLGSPTVISPVLNGIPGFYFSKNTTSASGGTGGTATGGTATGGNGYGAAAAAAAAAATAAAVGITPTSGVGATGSTSGTSGSSAGPGDSGSNSKGR